MNPEEIPFWFGQDFKVFISFMGAFQGFILAAIVLFYPQKHRTSNRLLFAFIFFQAYLLIAIRFAEWAPAHLAWVIYSVRLSVFVLLYLYIKNLYTKIQWKKEWIHLPIIFIDVVLLRELVLYKIPIVQETGVNFYQFFGSTFEILFLLWLTGTMVFYFYLTYQTVRKYQKKAEGNFSDLNIVGIKWVKQIFYGKFILEITDYLSFYVVFEFWDWYLPYHGVINAVLSTAFMYFITIKGKLNPKIYQLRMAQEKEGKTDDIIEEKLDAEKEVSEDLKEIADRVEGLMLKQKLFKEEGLSVKEVAENLDVQPYLVSQAINSCLGKNFFDLVNGYRVEEAKKLMMDESLNHLSMIGIGFEAGFSSKTAFNTAFKKHTGLTPSEYKRSQLILES